MMLPLLVAAGTALAALIADLPATGPAASRWRWPWAVALLGTGLTIAAAMLTPTSPVGLFCAGPGAGPAGRLDCSYAFDGRARLVAVLTAALTGVALLLYAPALSRAEAPAGEASFLLAAAMTGGVVVGGAGDLITLIIALETLTLPLYALVALHRRRAGRAAAAAATFFLTSVVATALSQLGAALLYLGTGRVYLRALGGDAVFDGAVPADQVWASVGLTGLVVLLVGLAFKVAAVPLHAWAPATYDGAPVPVAMFLSTASKLGGVVAILIVVEAALGGTLGRLGPAATVHTAVGGTLAALAVLSMVVGTLVALRQQRTVRLLAWSSVAQAGFILAPLGGLIGLRALEPVAAGGLLDAALAYTLFFLVLEAGAFSAVVALRPGAADGGGLDELRGLGRTSPWRAAALALALIGLAGLPPVLAGLFAKITVVQALVGVDSYGLALLVALISVVGLAVYWRPLALLYRGAPESEPVSPAGILASPLVALSLATVAGLVLTVAPQLLYAMVSLVR